MRMHHQKTGGNRNAGRNTVSVSVAVLLALVMLAAGVCGGFLLTVSPNRRVRVGYARGHTRRAIGTI